MNKRDQIRNKIRTSNDSEKITLNQQYKTLRNKVNNMQLQEYTIHN